MKVLILSEDDYKKQLEVEKAKKELRKAVAEKIEKDKSLTAKESK